MAACSPVDVLTCLLVTVNVLTSHVVYELLTDLYCCYHCPLDIQHSCKERQGFDLDAPFTCCCWRAAGHTTEVERHRSGDVHRSVGLRAMTPWQFSRSGRHVRGVPTDINHFHRDHAFTEVEFWFLGSFWDSIKQLCVLVKAGEKQPLALRSTSSTFLEKNPHPMLNSTCTHGDVQRLWQVKMVERIFLWENKVENSCSYGQTTSKICRTSQDRRNQERQSGKSWVQHTGKGYCSPWGRPVSRHGQ